MKKFIVMALAALSIAALPAAAQTQNADQKTCTQQTCDTGKDGKFAKAVKGDKSRQQRCLFDGIQLTDTQKSQIQALKDKRQAEVKVARDQKQRGDSTMRAARLDAKKDYLNQLKSILGPEAYVQFLENNYLYGGGDRGSLGQMGRQKGKNFRGELKGNLKRGDMKTGDQRKGGKKAMRAAQSAASQAVEAAQ